MRRTPIYLVVLVLAFACSGKEEEAPAEAPQADADPSAPLVPRIDSTTIIAAGQPVEVPVEKMVPEGFPYETYVVKGTETRATCTDAQCELLLTLPAEIAGDESATVHILVRSDIASSEEDEPAVTGEDGLFAQRGWTPGSEYTDGMELIAPMVRKRIDFEHSDGVRTGFVLLGDLDDGVLRVTALAPRGNERLAGLAGISASTLVRTGSN